MAVATPFVTKLRARAGVVRIGEGGERLVLRVEVPELWDTLAFDVRSDLPVAELKREALARFGYRDPLPADFVMKIRGFEVLGEEVGVAASGAKNGSTYLLSYRRRRPVR